MSDTTIETLAAELDQLAVDTGFSGVFRIDDGADSVVQAFGLADRRFQIPNTPSTRFALASGAKPITALIVMSLIEEGSISFDTPVRTLLGTDLPLIDDRVTVEHLLGHRSGIGDYLDEDVLGQTDYAMPIPVHLLVDTEDYLPVLDGFTQVFEPDTDCVYNNGGYVVLAVIAARAAGVPYHQLAHERVLEPAGMARSAFFRSDELPGDAATGYVYADTDQTNTLHMPVRGLGDGGIYAPVEDVSSFWWALLEGRIVSPAMVERALTPHSTSEGFRCGLGFWMPATGPAVQFEGADVGISFRTTHDPERQRTVTVVSNTPEGAFPLVKHARLAWF